MIANRVADTIGQVGLIVRLHSTFPVQEVIEIGDAMMATPIPIMAISLASLDALDAIAELVHRFGKQMLVGADDVESLEQIDKAQAVGARFVLGSDFSPERVRVAFRRQIVPIPTISTERDLRAARQLGCRLLSLAPESIEPLTGDAVDGMPIRWLVRDGVDLQNIRRYARSGATAVCIGGEPIPHIDWSAAALITRARRLRSAWESGRIEGQR